MHDTADLTGGLFAKHYAKQSDLIVDVGGQDVNGSLRRHFSGCRYISLDIEPGRGVDIVVPPGERFPFKDGEVDAIVSTSCFEHDPCFWMTFREMCRVVKLGGHIYMSAPHNGGYHAYPVDSWRFYPDAGQALAYWSGKKFGDQDVYPVCVLETFLMYPIRDGWTDFVCVWKRTDTPQTIITNNSMNEDRIKRDLIAMGCKIL